MLKNRAEEALSCKPKTKQVVNSNMFSSSASSEYLILQLIILGHGRWGMGKMPACNVSFRIARDDTYVCIKENTKLIGFVVSYNISIYAEKDHASNIFILFIAK